MPESGQRLFESDAMTVSEMLGIPSNSLLGMTNI